MTMIYKAILTVVVILLCSLSLKAEQYVSGQNIFEVTEISGKYEVVCRRVNGGISSRNRNIHDRQFRMAAVDLIGAYILFKKNNSISPDKFQEFVDGVNLHYTAYVEGLKLEQRNIDGKTCIVYICDKSSYNIESATYNHDYFNSTQ